MDPVLTERASGFLGRRAHPKEEENATNKQKKVEGVNGECSGQPQFPQLLRGRVVVTINQKRAHSRVLSSRGESFLPRGLSACAGTVPALVFSGRRCTGGVNHVPLYLLSTADRPAVMLGSFQSPREGPGRA